MTKQVLFLTIFTFMIILNLTGNDLSGLSKNQWPQMTMINEIEFEDGTYAPSYPGCSFLLDTGEEILGVTCKHSLWTGKNDKMDYVGFNGQVKNWKMHLKNDSTRYLIVDKLINEDKNEKINEWNTDKDYLVFTIKENHSGVKPLKINPGFLQKDEKVYTVGWAFKDKEGPQRIYTSSFYKYSGNSILVIDSVRQNLAGTSGSPVINRAGNLSGIISSWKFDKASNGWYPAPCSVDYLWEVLYDYWLKKHAEQKSVKSFQKFVKHYESVNSVTLEVSGNLLVNLFFDNWLEKNDIFFGETVDFYRWQKEMSVSGYKIDLPVTLKDQLKFNSWGNLFLMDKETIDGLSALIDKKNISPDWAYMCRFATKLSENEKFKLAIDLMNFTLHKFPSQGQTDFFLGEIYLVAGNKEAAKTSYENCLKKYPGYPFAVEMLEKLRSRE